MPSETENLFLGRQPILDRQQNLVAYELLFRSGQANGANISCDFTATTTVINHAFNELGIETALGSSQGFINLSESLLMSDIIELLPKEKIVLEVLETVEITESVIERCNRLKAMGFTLALDDFIHFNEKAIPLLNIVDIVKIDIMPLDSATVSKLANQLNGYNVRLLAEKVENKEQFDHCLDLGFSLFQGYYFAKPQIISGKKMSHSELMLMKLLGQVMGEAELSEIEQTLKANPVLSFNLLKLTNSVASGTRQQITSIKHAVTILGRRQLQRWVQLLLYSNSGSSDASPTPLLQLAATRGKMMELLTTREKNQHFSENAFMTGIMSLMDALLGMPMKEILSPLPISAEVQDALIERVGKLGHLLSLVEAVESTDMEKVQSKFTQLPYLNLHDLNVAQTEALAWSSAIGKAA